MQPIIDSRLEAKRLDRQAMTWFDLPFPLAADPVQVGSSLWCPFYEIVDSSPFGKTRTDADRYGLIQITLNGPPFDLRMYSLPLVFPPQATGYRGAKRECRIRGVSSDEIFISVKSPFLRQDVRGDDEFLYSFQTKTNVWYRWRRKGSSDLERTTLAAGIDDHEFNEEDHENAVCSGGMILTFDENGDPRLHIDTTPYHLKNAKPDANTESALLNEKEQCADWQLQDLDRVEFRDWFNNVEQSSKTCRWRVFETDSVAYEIQDPKSFLKFASERLRILGMSSIRSIGNFRVSAEGRERLAVFLRVSRGDQAEPARTLDSLLLSNNL